MNQLNLFVELTRLKKPIGYMLLFWPCAWGLTLVYNFSESLDKYFFYLILFFLGAILMRSAGCIVNDILDRKFDKKVSRTKNRPIASGKISVHLGFFYAITLCFFASSKNDFASFKFKVSGFSIITGLPFLIASDAISK